MASQTEAGNAKWTHAATDLFVSLMVEEVKKRNRTSCTFNKSGWKIIRIEFNTRSGLGFTQLQLRNKMNKLRRQFGSFKKLLGKSEFGWDNVNKTVSVDDPKLWEEHIKGNTKWAKFKKDGSPYYSELILVFGDTYVTGEHAVGIVNDLESEEGNNGGDNADGDPSFLCEHQIDEGVFTSGEHNLDRTPNTKRRRKSKAFDVASTCKALQEMIKTRASQLSDSAATSQVTSAPEDPFSVSNVIKVLLSIPNLEEDLYHKALERACASATWREAFIQTPSEVRNGILRRL